MTLEEFNKDMAEFLPFYNELFRTSMPETFVKFKIYSFKEENNFHVLVFAQLKDGKENRVYKCSTVKSVKRSLNEVDVKDDTIERMAKFIKGSFIETLMFSKDIIRLINEGDLYFLNK